VERQGATMRVLLAIMALGLLVGCGWETCVTAEPKADTCVTAEPKADTRVVYCDNPNEVMIGMMMSGRYKGVAATNNHDGSFTLTGRVGR